MRFHRVSSLSSLLVHKLCAGGDKWQSTERVTICLTAMRNWLPTLPCFTATSQCSENIIQLFYFLFSALCTCVCQHMELNTQIECKQEC